MQRSVRLTVVPVTCLSESLVRARRLDCEAPEIRRVATCQLYGPGTPDSTGVVKVVAPWLVSLNKMVYDVQCFHKHLSWLYEAIRIVLCPGLTQWLPNWVQVRVLKRRLKLE